MESRGWPTHAGADRHGLPGVTGIVDLCPQVALPTAGPEAEAGTVELHVQTCPETSLLAPHRTLLPPALGCPPTAQPGGMEAREPGKWWLQVPARVVAFRKPTVAIPKLVPVIS